MGLVEGVLFVAVVVIAGAVLGAARRRMLARSPDPPDKLLGAAHERIDDIELARVRSMLQRR